MPEFYRPFSGKFGHSPFGILLLSGAAHRAWYPFRADPTPPSGHAANPIPTYVCIQSELMTGKNHILEQIRAVAAEQSKVLAPLTDDLPARRNRPRLAWFRHPCVPARRPDWVRPFWLVGLWTFFPHARRVHRALRGTGCLTRRRWVASSRVETLAAGWWRRAPMSSPSMISSAQRA